MPTRIAGDGARPTRAAPVEALPHDPLGVAVILTPLASLADAGEDAAARAWAEFEAFLLGGLREMWRRSPPEQRGGADVLARARLHLLTLAIDAEGAAHVCVTLRRDLGGPETELARRTLEATASLIFERLATRWPLRIRTGPYTTAPWRADA
jgi:hypothetical protein